MTSEIKLKDGSPLSIPALVHSPSFLKRTQDTLGEGAQQFLSSVLSLYNADKELQKCRAEELYNCCLMAAALKLPFNKDLGQAWIVPYKGKPQLQIGWKGFVQLAQRSGLFKTINCTDVRSGEIKKIDRLTGEIEFEWIDNDEKRLEADVVGYVAYFKLLNGFEKNLYMTKAELNAHAGKYSQTYKAGFGVWKDNFDAMAQKTVIKLLLNRFAPLSVDMAKAIEVDQSDTDGKYIDRRPVIKVEGAELGESEDDRRKD